MLQAAIEQEVDAYVQERTSLVDEHGHRLVVRNGPMPERTILTGLGAIDVRQLRVHDRRSEEDGRERFESKLLPRYLRRTKNLDGLLPWLYLRGISTGDFPEAMSALLGKDAPGISATTIGRLKQSWEEEHANWSKRSLEGKRYVYLWVDGIHFNIRLQEDRQCILVILGATADGQKELIAVHDGFRESEQSWLELLRDLKQRGLATWPELVIGDGALGFWKALPKVYAKSRVQRCWVHKTANVLNKLPKSKHAFAKVKLHEIWMAATLKDAERAFASFVETFSAKYPAAVECLTKDKDALLAFYDFPAEHWKHLRTTNPIESTFATVRLRTRRTKGSGSRAACLAMVFKLVEVAAKTWRLLDGAPLLQDVIRGVQFKDGIKVNAA